MAITKEHIWKVADELAGEGIKPTLAAVRARLEGGSYTTISEAMTEWRTRKGSTPTLPTQAAPTAITERATGLVGELWALAMHIADERLAKERAALEEARVEMEEARAEAVRAADELADTIEKLQAELVQAHEAVAKAQAATAMAQSERAEAEKRTAVAEARVEEIRLRVEELKGDEKVRQRKLAKANIQQATEQKS